MLTVRSRPYPEKFTNKVCRLCVRTGTTKAVSESTTHRSVREFASGSLVFFLRLRGFNAAMSVMLFNLAEDVKLVEGGTTSLPLFVYISRYVQFSDVAFHYIICPWRTAMSR